VLLVFFFLSFIFLSFRFTPHFLSFLFRKL